MITQRFNRAEASKEIRRIAKEAGLTFKKQNAYINGSQAYKMTDRLTGETVCSNFTFWSMYQNCMTGYISSYNKQTKQFDGI